MTQPVIIECYSCDDLNFGCCGDEIGTEIFKGIVIRDGNDGTTVLAKLHDGFEAKVGADYVALKDHVGGQYKVELSNTTYSTIADLKAAVAACKCPVGTGGGGGGDTITNFTWNPVGNILTITTDAGTFPVALTMNDGQVTTSAPLTINNTVFPVGTTVADILAALASASHPAMVVTNNVAPFSFDPTTQVLNIPAMTTIVDNGDGTTTYTFGDGSAPLVVENGNTSTEHTVGTTVFPIGTDIDDVLAALINLHPLEDYQEIVDTDLATAGTPTDADVAAFVTNNNLLDTKIYYVGNGTALDPDYVWSVDEDGTTINIESPSSGGGFKRLVDNSSTLTQTLGGDVTLVRSAGSGVVTIPADVDKLEDFNMVIDAANGDQGGDSSYEVCFDYQGTRAFNQNTDFSDVEMPNIQMWVYNTEDQITTTTADAHEVTVSGGQLCVKFLNALQSSFDKRLVKFEF